MRYESVEEMNKVLNYSQMEFAPKFTQNVTKKNFTANYCKYNNISPLSNDTVCFKGHTIAEKFGKNGIELLKQETGFFRDLETLLSVKKFIEENLKNKDVIRIVSGGCSTGEEAVSVSMILDGLKDKVQILGIDLGEKAIEKAKSRKYLFQDVKNLPELFNVEDFIKGLKDRFLVFDVKKDLTETEKMQKKLFDEFFDVTTEVIPSQKIPFKQKIQNYITRLFFPKFKPIEFESKIVKLKDGKADNCTFKCGDITDINDLTEGKKSDIIFFKNAIYHMITEEAANGLIRRIKPDGEEITEKIISKLKENLNDGGLICFGEDEMFQTMDSYVVPKVMEKLGFKPILKTPDKETNIWQKIK